MNDFIKRVVREWLESNGYEGLAGDECGCKLDDLFPCGQIGDDCVPGYIIQWGAGGECPLYERGVCECGYEDVKTNGFCMTANKHDRRVIQSNGMKEERGGVK